MGARRKGPFKATREEMNTIPIGFFQRLNIPLDILISRNKSVFLRKRGRKITWKYAAWRVCICLILSGPIILLDSFSITHLTGAVRTLLPKMTRFVADQTSKGDTPKINSLSMTAVPP